MTADGEIFMRGPTMMLGYRNLPDKTAETIDAQGWLHSVISGNSTRKATSGSSTAKKI